MARTELSRRNGTETAEAKLPANPTVSPYKLPNGALRVNVATGSQNEKHNVCDIRTGLSTTGPTWHGANDVCLSPVHAGRRPPGARDARADPRGGHTMSGIGNGGTDDVTWIGRGGRWPAAGAARSGGQ